MRHDTDTPPRARIPADVDTPDKLVFGLTARQAAILAVTALVCYVLWRMLATTVPRPVLLAAMIPMLAAGAVLAVGRRDGMTMDAWLYAALRHQRAPKRAVPAPDGPTAPPAWAPDLPGGTGPHPAVLRLPADAIAADGTVDLGDGRAATMVATTTVNIGLRTGDEQWALLAGYGRWLNGLTAGVQMVVSTRRADLTGHAARVAHAAAGITHPALAAAAEDYAAFLLDIAAGRDPLAHTVTIVCTASGSRAAAEARRHGEHTAAALGALDVDTRVLDGGAALAAVTVATDPYQFGEATHCRALPGVPLTAPTASKVDHH